jgi:hypothetical protein
MASFFIARIYTMIQTGYHPLARYCFKREETGCPTEHIPMHKTLPVKNDLLA